MFCVEPSACASAAKAHAQARCDCIPRVCHSARWPSSQVIPLPRNTLLHNQQSLHCWFFILNLPAGSKCVGGT
jgi:hypothetical protein